MTTCECLDCRELFATDEEGCRDLFSFILGHRLCTRLYTCPDGTRILAKRGTKPLMLEQ